MRNKPLIVLATIFLIIISATALLSQDKGAFAGIETVKLSVEQTGEIHKYYTGDPEDGGKGGVELYIKANILTDVLEYEYDYYTKSETIPLTDAMQVANEGTTDAYKYTTVKVYKNSTLTFKAVLNKGDKELETEEEDSFEVKNIDNKAPKLDKNKYTVPTRVGSDLQWQAYITDDNAASFSANSGIKEINVFCYNQDAIFDPTKPLDSLQGILETKFSKKYGDFIITPNTTVEFKMDKNGWYFVYMIDNMGNISYDLFSKYEEEPQYIVQTAIGDVPVNVALYKNYITQGKGKYNLDILDNLASALDRFVVAFQLDRPKEEKLAAYMLLKEAVTAYNEAEITYDTHITNPELLDGRLYAVNLDSVASLLPGDTLEIGLIVTSYNQSDLKRFAYPQVVSLSGISAPGKIIRVTYNLVKNNAALTPGKPIIFHIEFPKDAEVTLVTSANNNGSFAVKDYVRDNDIIQFTTDSQTEEFYFVIKYASKGSGGLIIGLVSGGVGLLAIIAIIVVIYIKRKKAAKVNPDEEDEPPTVCEIENTVIKKSNGKKGGKPNNSKKTDGRQSAEPDKKGSGEKADGGQNGRQSKKPNDDINK